MAKAKRLCAALLLAGTLAGCATSGGNPADPFEPFNRAMFSFNDTVDTAVIKPVAKGYRRVVPGILRTGISNFFSNLEDVWISVNNVLQGKFREGFDDFTRVLFNSTFGVAGIFDFASDVGLQKHNEDFGQTLGWWGVGSGAYLVLPILGPSTIRDGFGLLLDTQADLVFQIDGVPVHNSLYATRAIGKRASLLDASSVIEQAALDKYAFIRDAWLQRRLDLVYDGDPPRQPEEPDDEPTK
ncbi:MAG TPA: VacJ family lipoprotein [Burkholderiales bacterium]|jgi:phospholipid-binding lipoprotein MlaA|nr:VacJ family lipoprotein [Burkholderiales bacterium]